MLIKDSLNGEGGVIVWVVGIDRPYYPEMEFFEDELEAKLEYKGLEGKHMKDGHHDVKIFIAKIEDVKDILTYY